MQHTKSMGFGIFLEYIDLFDIFCQLLLHFTWQHKIQATEDGATKVQLLPSSRGFDLEKWRQKPKIAVLGFLVKNVSDFPGCTGFKILRKICQRAISRLQSETLRFRSRRKKVIKHYKSIFLEGLKWRAYIYQTLKHDLQSTLQKKNSKAFPKYLHN